MIDETHGHLNDVVTNQEADGPIEEAIEAHEQPKESEDFSRKFAALSRKEKAIRSRESEYEKKLAELEEKLKASDEKPKEVEVPLERRLRSNPLKALEELGLPYDKLTELALNDGQLTSDMQMKLMREELENDYKSKFEALEERLSEKDKVEEQKRYDNVQKNFIDEIGSFVEKNKEEYEFISVNKADNVVYDVIEEHYNETGRILEVKEAADAVESYLEEEAEKLLNLTKVKNRLSRKENEHEPEPQRQSQVTLSNAQSAQANERVERKLTDEESKREIAKMLQWEN
tara:strand:- start:1342 stop:2205 length:864 start_codon:yes stop_codon:yes gene_type:complete